MKKVLLENEITMVFQPKLAEIFGVTESIILQQMHYWLLKSKHIIDGTPWIYNSYEAWHSQINFLCKRTIIRAIKKLEDAGVVLSSNFNKSKMDKTKWYTINYEKLESLYDAFVDNENSKAQHDYDSKNKTYENLNESNISAEKECRSSKHVDKANKLINRYNLASSVMPKSQMDNANFNKAIPEITTETSFKEEEKKREFSDVVNFYRKNISCASPYEIQQLKVFMDDFDSKDLIILGMKQALKSNAKNLRYIEKVLYSWKHKGLKQEEEVIDFLKNYKKHKGGKKVGKSERDYGKSPYFNSKIEKREYGNHKTKDEKNIWHQRDLEGLI
ncbi:DnaD domain protein [Clostridium sp. P21]|uniref:DnaD domain protein n=1 Tax=Clostridium muellerianum TaxID=2716538 RepID=A0A7Y0ELY1_9CLOT|nr:DnaD domain protein [Clostridium muellerianum]NMM65811.1 DnaD domain protein [Clostridium muellerianum]